MNTKSCYRELTNYKYQLLEEFRYKIDITGHKIDLPFIKLDDEGNLIVLKYYA